MTSYVHTLIKSLQTSPTQPDSIGIENDSTTISHLLLLSLAPEPVFFPFCPLLYPAWESHGKRETLSFHFFSLFQNQHNILHNVNKWLSFFASGSTVS